MTLPIMRFSTFTALLLFFLLVPTACESGRADDENSPPADQDVESEPDGDRAEADVEREFEIEAEAERVQQTRLEPFRPQYHFSPTSGWMNDPNGLVYLNGEYHLFFQYAPAGFFNDSMHWGHAVSRDLFHWEELPPALYPSEEMGKVFSGSAVVDAHNSSGLCADDSACLVALFTHSGGESGNQKQSLAFSNDDGRTWQMYENNPIIANPGIKDFRDPKVFLDSSHSRWIMLLSVGDGVAFYASENLIDWQPLSTFSASEATAVGVWECPDLYRLPVENRPGEARWVLQVDVFSGGPHGGSGAMAFIGDFDGERFVADDPNAIHWLDWGMDFYAAQSFSDLPQDDGRRVAMAWMNNWSYALSLPTEAWKGAMTLPRELALREMPSGELKVVQHAAREWQSLRRAPVAAIQTYTLDGELALVESSDIRRYEIEAEFLPPENGKIQFSLAFGSQAQTRIVFDADTRSLNIDRSASGLTAFATSFAGVHGATLPQSETVHLRVFIDRSSVEVFAQNGAYVITEQIFPPEGAFMLSVQADASANIRFLNVYPLASVWP